ncbi:hypothetical protein PITC_032390 [Penicillium italicum]|uniref:F-box domain-containing protein n=1 Tax=Penicillium italicum TaxID=40296 RepID=A0A0A2L761_PENIT|nr:hypothetical protein PITC_032390 [Penicillium italicum]
MQILDLSNEILISIGKFLGKYCLDPLLQTCRRFCSLLHHYLY